MASRSPFYWVEASGVIEEQLVEKGAFPIPGASIGSLPGAPAGIKNLSDGGYHYTRFTNDSNCWPIEKIICGFHDPDILQKIDTDLCVRGFMSYSDFLRYQNSDEVQNNELQRRIASLVNTKEKWAIQFVATLEEYYGGGLSELTQYMSDAFSDAIQTLQHSSNAQSNLYLNIGLDLQSFMTPLVIHLFDGQVVKQGTKDAV